MSVKYKQTVWAFAALWMVMTVAGCGGSSGGIDKVAVGGTVTYQGKPLEDGEIRLVPIKDTKGPACVAIISRGGYAIMARGGVPVGTHRVEIKAYLPIPGAKPYTAEQADGQWDIKAGDLPKRQILPDKYNQQSTLELVVEPGAENAIRNFDLP